MAAAMKPECRRAGDSRFHSAVVTRADTAKAQKNAKRVLTRAPVSEKPPPSDGVGDSTSSRVAKYRPLPRYSHDAAVPDAPGVRVKRPSSLAASLLLGASIIAKTRPGGAAFGGSGAGRGGRARAFRGG
ncbi:hypothetical protein C1871_14855, partial [Eggerthella lenta]